MKKLNAKVSKKIAVSVLTAAATLSLMGCTGEKAVVNETIATSEEYTALVTYEFETFDNLKIVLDESNITAQEPSDDPEYSELVSGEARGNIIAPGRDFVYLEDDNNYYVADYSRKLITVADKSKVKVETVESGISSVAGTYSYTYTEELDGSEMEFTDTVVLNDDNTCEVTFQDTIAGKWDGSKITLDDGSEFEYKFEGDNLILNQNGVWITFSKKDTIASEGSAEEDIMENPGAFDTDSWSISYDTEKWYGYEDNDSVIINNLNAVAGSSFIEIKEVDVATIDDAIAMLQDTKGKKLTTPEKIEKAGSECYVTYDEPVDSKEEGVVIFDFYLIFENNGKVIIIDESITEDPDASRAEALSYEFDDVIDTFVIKEHL